MCFEPLTEAEQLSLPCHCTVAYCFRCWDRSLATSFRDIGAARCPTCRADVDVRLDSTSGQLVFSCAVRAEGADPQETRQAVVDRLYKEAAPVMARRLREWGSAHPTLRRMAADPAAALDESSMEALKDVLIGLGGDPAGCADDDRATLAARLEQAAGGSAALAAWCSMDARLVGSDAAGQGPRCVCGGLLSCMSGRARVRRYFREVYGLTLPDAPLEVRARLRWLLIALDCS